MSDYTEYRGKCKEFVDKLVDENTMLTPVRGWYICPIWGRQEHWWAIDETGKIIDPTAKQFPSKGIGEYVPLNGSYTCEQCGKEVKEENAIPMGNYVCCSDICARRLVGV